MRNCFVIRLTTDEFTFADIREELIVHERCREGWGPEGADLRGGVDFFIEALKKAWGGGVEDAARKYNNLLLMTKIKAGDLIIVPKVSITEPAIGQYFTVAECTAEYSFAPLPKYNDFGHIIGVKLLSTWDYRSANDSANIIGKLLKGISMSKPVNRIRNKETIQAVESLIGNSPLEEKNVEKSAPYEDYLQGFFKAVNNLPFSDPSRKNYLIIETLRMLSSDALKKMIKELFTRNGYRLINDESDLVFELFSERELMHDLYKPAAEPQKIFVRLKTDDEPCNELPISDGNIRILIDLANKSGAAIKEDGVILIDGETFANILARHAIP